VYWYGRRAGTAGAANVRSIIEADADQNVKNRGVSALASLPNNAGVAPLIDLARTSPQQSVRKEAVTALGRTKDPRAVAYLEELLRR
jgi:HEAT repeat protein